MNLITHAFILLLYVIYVTNVGVMTLKIDSHRDKAKCEPECKNKGICVDTNLCKCPSNYNGKSCEFEKKPCLTNLPIPMNAAMSCTPELCTFTCIEGYKFIDGSTVANMECLDGQWQSTTDNITSIPDCNPECTPPCQNGGVCQSGNTCQCPANYKGLQCQYLASVCDFRELAFNGVFSCSGDKERFNCRLSCPPGATFSSPPADVYTCLYSTGVFGPQPLPNCQFPINCPDGKVYQPCGPETEPSCEFPVIPPTTEESCVEGCFCPAGLLLESGRCVRREECPCTFKNKMFKPGSTIKKECNTCTCKTGEWTCTEEPCGARCTAVGDPHYTTFDGLRYDFMGRCSYTLLTTDNITVEVTNMACSRNIFLATDVAGMPSCTKEVSLTYRGVNIHLKQGLNVLVNGNEVPSLPVNIGDLQIRAASSLFIIVQMPNKVDLWWDGNTHIMIDVPWEWEGKTKGLCGTFNRNQNDDFSTPDGDVEQSFFAFANKWKTREFCSDIDTQEPEHPCKANIENKKAAEKYCSKLKSKVFEACHWYVDVKPYYEACVYDMCACGSDVSRCLCPILGDYAMKCASAGLMIQWRNNVQECKLQCSGGQEYTVCADSCQHKCSDAALATSETCRPICVEGCACPTGQLLDDTGVCVPTKLCPCFHKGVKFNAGYNEVRAGRREKELCTCVGARWDCKPVTPEKIKDYPLAEDLRTDCSATNNKEFTTCENAEPLTCKNMHLPPATTTEECRPGCQCKKGYVLDTVSKKCVQPAQCPCHHGGRSFPDGHTRLEECNKCVCKSGNWSCTQTKCAGICAAWGDSHVFTFDGTDYDFEASCTYILAKGVMDTKDGFNVEIQNIPCGTTGDTCSKSVTLKVGSGDSEEIVSLSRNAPLPDISKFKRIKMSVAGEYVFLDVPSLGMSLQWDISMVVYVKVHTTWQGRVKGLCGNYNNDTRDDFETPSGGGMVESSAQIFADSWKLKATCPKP